MNANKAQPELFLELADGKKRKLVLTLGALAKAEQKLGKSLFRVINWSDLGVRDVSLILWASLLSENPELTQDQSDDLFSMSVLAANMETLRELVEMLLSRALPEAEEQKSKKKMSKKNPIKK